MPKRSLLAFVLAVVAAATSCAARETDSRAGNESRDGAAAAVHAAQRSLENRKAGKIAFALTAATEESEPVGFGIDGEYSFEDDHELAVLDLTYRQVLGEDSTETQVVSNGEDAWVVVDEEATELTAAQTEALRVEAEGSSSAVPELDLARWLKDGELDEDGSRSTISGEVRASALIADLQKIAGQVAGTSAAALDSEAASQIDDAVESSEMTIESRDGTFQSLNAAVEFGAEVPRGLRDALGAYAAARLELSMSVEDVGTPLRVREPL